MDCSIEFGGGSRMQSGVLKETTSVSGVMGAKPLWMRREWTGPKESRMVTERSREGWEILVIFNQLMAAAG